MEESGLGVRAVLKIGDIDFKLANKVHPKIIFDI